MYVRAANHRQDFDPALTHAMERQIERLVCVHVGKIPCIHQLAKWLGSGARSQFAVDG